MTAWRPAAKATAVKQKQEFDELERQALSTLNDTATSKGTTVGKGDAGLNSTTSKSAMGLENTFRKLASPPLPAVLVETLICVSETPCSSSAHELYLKQLLLVPEGEAEFFVCWFCSNP